MTYISPYEIEREIRAELSGARLVFELGITEERYHTIRSAIERMAGHGRKPRALRENFPALYATYLAFTGVYRYEKGGLWPEVHVGLRDQNDQPGPEFRRALVALGMEPFDRLVEEERAQTWLTRILAHGGIPISCLEPFVELVAREISRGATDAADLMATWRTQHTRLSMLHQPTRRFLLYGGETAEDLLDRCIEVLRTQGRGQGLPSASEAGLPQYFLEAFRGLDSDVLRRTARSAQEASVPRPTVTLDPYSGLGPTVWLPPVPEDVIRGSWRVNDGEQLSRHQASAITGTSVRLVPARAYEVEFTSDQGEQRRFSFEGLQRLPALLLDPSTERLLRDPGVIAMEEVWLLTPSDVTVRAVSRNRTPVELNEVQELPKPGGAWAGWSLAHLDLGDVGGLELVQDGIVRRLAVTKPRARPELVGELVEGVTTADGAPVYSAPPRLDIPGLSGVENPVWAVTVTTADDRVKFLAEPDEDGAIDLGQLVEHGRYGVNVRGPLGSDLKATFAVVEGLEVKRPKHVVRPGNEVVDISARASSASISGGAVGSWTNIPIEDDATIARFTARRLDGETLELHAHVARLVWTVVHDTKPAVQPATKVLRVGAEEFDDQLADILVVRTGAPGTKLELELHGSEGKLLSRGPVTTTGKEGRWSFDLGPFADPIRRSDDGRLTLKLLVNDWPVHVADIVARIEVSNWLPRARMIDDFAEVVVSFTQQREIKGCVARLWPQHRPWEKPVEAPIDDGANEARFAGYDLLKPGPYLAEIAIADPWLAPRRPVDGGPTARTISVGDRDQFKEYVSRLDPADPHTHIVWALSGHDPHGDVDDEALCEAAGDIVAALAFALSEMPRDTPTPAAFHRLARLLTRSERILCHGLVSAAQDDLVRPAEMQRLSLRLLPCLAAGRHELGVDEAIALWRTSPIIAAALDVPAARCSEAAAARCETHLGWTPGVMLATGGAQVNQAYLAMPVPLLKDIQRFVGNVPAPLLDPAELQAATFEWLTRSAEYSESDLSSPRNWFFARYGLLRDALGATDAGFLTPFKAHLMDRLPPAGTEKWAGASAVTLCAAAHVLLQSPHASRALQALDEAMVWAPRLVKHDLLLVTTLLDVS